MKRKRRGNTEKPQRIRAATARVIAAAKAFVQMNRAPFALVEAIRALEEAEGLAPWTCAHCGSKTPLMTAQGPKCLMCRTQGT